MELIKTSTIESGLAGYKDQLSKIIKPEDLVREIGFAVQLVSASQKLRDCSQISIVKAVYNVALCGLSLNPIHKLTALVPKYIKDVGWEAVLMPQYQGLVKLLTDTGSILNVTANVVYEGDEFEYQLGTRPDIIHKPKHKSKEIAFAYAIATLYDGRIQVEVMDKTELDEIRDKSETYIAYTNGKLDERFVFWLAWAGEMSRKSVLKRLTKYLPKTDRFELINQAIEIDNSEYKISYGQEDYLYTLINNSTFDDDTKAVLDSKVRSGLNPNEFDNLKNELIQNQVNPVFESARYNQTDLSNQLKNIGQDNRRTQ